MRSFPYLFLCVIIIAISGCTARNLHLSSPDGNLSIKVKPCGNAKDNSIASFSMRSGQRQIILPSSLYINTDNAEPVGKINVIRIETGNFSETWANNFGEKKTVPDEYKELKIYFSSNKGRINLICRAYNEGVALAYEIPEQEGKDSVLISDENIIFRFPADHFAWSAPRAQAQYKKVPLTRIDKGCERPLVIEPDSSFTIALGEAGLTDYPRMKFDPDSTGGISIKSRLDGNVKRKIPFRSPWRFIMTGKCPGNLIENNYFLLNLNEPSQIGENSWIRPGKVLREVTLTSEGGKAAVDFTSTHNMQYVEFDAGWYGPENKDESDARAVNVDPARSKGPLDLREVVSYASSKNIGILLYVNRKALEKQIDELLPIYSTLGIAGIKFGFVQVGNQNVTNWLHESAKKLASYKMIMDVHDEYRPTGFSRTYPNFLTQEGIRGDEESPSNSHTLITMFTRMIAGPADNTVCYYNERVDKKMGSHASQLAKTVCLFSPLQFLYWYDRPSNIGDEPELEFFNNVPTVWDETKVLYGKIGEYGMIARKKGDDWFIGGINGTNARTLRVTFDFLDPEKKYSAKIYSDDPAIDTRTHVRIDSMAVDNGSVLPVSLKANNGVAIQVSLMK